MNEFLAKITDKMSAQLLRSREIQQETQIEK